MVVAAQYIPALIESIVAKAKVNLSDAYNDLSPEDQAKVGTAFADLNFDKGHYQEVVNNLVLKDGNPNKPKKYPLVWLVMDMEEDIMPKLGVYANVKVHLIIAMDTLPTLTMDERAATKFIPILLPIYKAVIEAIADSKYLFNSLPESMRHKKIDRPYWGKQDENGNGSANLFNDCIDAIQVKDLTLSVKKQFCETFSI